MFPLNIIAAPVFPDAYFRVGGIMNSRLYLLANKTFNIILNSSGCITIYITVKCSRHSALDLFNLGPWLAAPGGNVNFILTES